MLAGQPALPARFEAGRSVEGRRIVAVRRGRADAPIRLLVSGSTHGTEPAGHAIVARLRRMHPPDGVQVWTVRTFNPDGVALGTRQNARGVDLNRNFPYRLRADALDGQRAPVDRVAEDLGAGRGGREERDEDRGEHGTRHGGAR